MLRALRIPIAWKSSVIFLLLFSAWALAAASDNAHEKLTSLIDREWQYELATSPEEATAVGDNRYNDRLSDYSAEAFEKRERHDSQVIAELKAISPSGLGKEDQLNRLLLTRMLQTEYENLRLKNWEMPVDQMNGPHLEYAGLAEDMPFHTARDYENYASRLRQLPLVFSQLTDDMRAGMRDHLMPPRYLLEKVAAEAQDVASKQVDQSSFATLLRHFPEAISANDRDRLSKEIRLAIGKHVLPAYADFAHFIKDEYAPRGRTEFGVWSLPEGDIRYRQAIRAMTTTDMDPEQLHLLGLKQVAE